MSRPHTSQKRTAFKAARKGGDPIVRGAPNVACGGSHIGSLGAGGMVGAERRTDRLALWSLVSTGPARAVGLPDGFVPAIQGTGVAGRCAYRGIPAG